MLDLNVKMSALLAAGALAAGLAMGGWLGYRVAAGGYESRIADAARAAVEAQNTAVEAANRAAKAEHERAVQAIESRARASVSAQEVINEIHVAPDARNCEWSDDQRMRIQRIYAIYSANSAPAIGVRATLPGASADGAEARTVGSGNATLRARVPEAAQ